MELDVLKLKTLEQEIAAEAKLRLEYSVRTWKASEIAALREKIRASGGDPEERLGMGLGLGEIERQAKAEGRWVDDLSPTYPNLRARFGAGAWIIPRCNVGLIGEWAKSLDEQVRRSGPAPQGAGAATYHRASLDWIGWCSTTGHVSSEAYLGVLFESAAPDWFFAKGYLAQHHEGGWVSRVVRRGSDEEKQNADLAAAQAARWAVLEDTWRLLAELVRAGAKALDDLPPQLEGMVWKPWPSLAAPEPGLLNFTRDTREAAKYLSSRARATLDAQKARAIAEIEQRDAYNARLAQGADPVGDPTIVLNRMGPRKR